MSIGIGLQALGAGWQGGNPGAVIERQREQLESAERKKRVASLLERMNISGPQRAILETMPAAQVPGLLWQMQQQEMARRAAGGAAAAKAAEERRKQELYTQALQEFGQQPQRGSAFSTGVPAGDIPSSGASLSLGEPSVAPQTSAALSFSAPTPQSPYEVAQARLRQLTDHPAQYLPEGDPRRQAWKAYFDKYQRDVEMFAPEEQTDTMQTLRARAEAAGIRPGTEAYRQFFLNNGSLPTEEDGFRPATREEAARYGAEAGQFGPDNRFYPINPPSGMAVTVNPDGSFSLVQGAGAGSDLTSGTRADIERTQTAFESINSGLQRYREIVQEGGGSIVPGVQRDKLLSARRDMQLQLKELYNLGVLNGPDLTLMNEMLVDATDPVNVGLDAIGVADLQERTNVSVDQLISQLRNLAGPKLRLRGLEISDGGAIVPIGSAQQPEPEVKSGTGPVIYETFEQFSADELMKRAADDAGVELKTMWEIYQERQKAREK